MPYNKLVTKLSRRTIELIIIVAIQQIVIFATLYFRGNILFKTFVVTSLVVMLVPIGYLLSRMIAIISSICWIALYSAWLFTFVDEPPLVAIALIITVPILIMTANNLKNSKKIVMASYNNYINKSGLQSHYVDPYYGFANNEAFINKYQSLQNHYKSQMNLDYYIIGIKFSYYDQTVEHIGYDVFTDYVQETTNTIKRNVILVNEFYTLSHNVLGLIIPYATKYDIDNITNQIKKYFHTNVKYDRYNNTYRISVQIASINGNTLQIEGIDKSELVDRLIRKVEEDINAEYF